MIFVSVTRLRLRSRRFLPGFAMMSWRADRQLRRADGFLQGSLLADRRLAFWTLTAWRDEAAMRAYMTAGAHREAMPSLLAWCDEASVAHWVQEERSPPSWAEAGRRMRESGRPSRVRTPGPRHADMSWEGPRTFPAARTGPKTP